MIVFKAGFWFSNSKGDNKTMKDLVAIVDGKAQLKSMYEYFIALWQTMNSPFFVIKAISFK